MFKIHISFTTFLYISYHHSSSMNLPYFHEMDSNRWLWRCQESKTLGHIGSSLHLAYVYVAAKLNQRTPNILKSAFDSSLYVVTKSNHRASHTLLSQSAFDISVYIAAKRKQRESNSLWPKFTFWPTLV